MTYTVLFVVALICVSGFIAYFGDLLGRKMGKKRLTLFNMRPRYTAIVVTTITGMLISGLALATLVSVNSQFRKVLFRYEHIIRQNSQLLKSNSGLVMLGAKLRSEVARQQKQLAKALKDARLAKTQRDLAQKSVARLQREIAARQRELADLRTRTGIAEGELEQKRGELALMQAQFDKEQEQLRLARAQVAETERQLGAVQAKLKDTQDALTAMTTGGNTAVDLALNLRFKDIVFRQGDELARGILDPSLTNVELRHEIHELLDKASDKALSEGAKIGQNGRAVNLRYQEFSDRTESLVVKWNEAANIESAANKIASAIRPVLVQVVCGSNALRDEQVPVEVRLYLNETVLRKGDLVADIKVDGKQSEGYILLALNSFMQTDVAKAAMQVGVVPVVGQDPRAALGPNRQAQADELLNLVNKIKEMNALTSVSVYAAADIHAADTLNMSNIRFGVKKAD